MKRILFLSLFLACFLYSKSDLLTDIVDGKFRPKTPASFHSMNDGEHFSQLIDTRLIVKYNFKTGNAVDTILNISKIENSPINYILGYSFSNDESKILIQTKATYRYRRTFTSKYYVYNVDTKKIISLSEYGEQEVPIFSPNGKWVAFARQNNIYLKDIQHNTEKAVTTDGLFNKVINGTPDWVYEEEFGLTRYFSFSPDSKSLSFLRFDESKVPLFSMMRYLNENDPDKLEIYPTVETFKYPKPGQNNSLVSVHIYQINEGTTLNVKLPKFDEEFYIPRLDWTNNTDKLAVYVLNRHQNKLDMFFADRNSGETTLVWNDTDKYYVDYENIDNIYFFSDNQKFIYVSEKDGFAHAYLYQIATKKSQQLTQGAWDITKVYGFDEKSQILYYQSAETSPLQRNIYSIHLKGKKLCLTNKIGTHDAVFSSTFTYFADNFSSMTTPNIVTLRNNQGKEIRELINNQSLLEQFNKLPLPKKEFFTFTTSEGITLNGWILKPQQINESEKYPLLMVQYSGPNSQQVLDSWKIDWEYYLSQQGYAVACIDGRGTGARGSEFRKCTYKKLGVLETKDQVEAAKYLATLPFIDKSRIGIWGWSYGGFMVLNAMSTDENIFKAGISVAPVTDWRLYNSAYTERFMRTPQENKEGYDAGSPLEKVDKLKGNLLIVHGTADDNVHLQNTMVYINKLTDADKQVQLYTYTDKNHSILGRTTREHLYKKKFEFLEKNLK